MNIFITFLNLNIIYLVLLYKDFFLNIILNIFKI